MDSMRTLALTWLDALELRLLADSKVCVLATEFVVTCRSPMLRRNLQSSTSPKPSMRLTYIPQTTNGSSSSRIFVKVAEASRSRFGKLRLADQLLINALIGKVRTRRNCVLLPPASVLPDGDRERTFSSIPQAYKSRTPIFSS